MLCHLGFRLGAAAAASVVAAVVGGGALSHILILCWSSNKVTHQTGRQDIKSRTMTGPPRSPRPHTAALSGSSSCPSFPPLSPTPIKHYHSVMFCQLSHPDRHYPWAREKPLSCGMQSPSPLLLLSERCLICTLSHVSFQGLQPFSVRASTVVDSYVSVCSTYMCHFCNVLTVFSSLISISFSCSQGSRSQISDACSVWLPKE